MRIPKNPTLEAEWEGRFLDRGVGKKPHYLVIVERAGDLFHNHSGAYPARVKRFHWAGYDGVLKHVDASSCGSPTWGSFFVTLYYHKSLGVDPELLPRSFQNCLLPVGVPRNLWAPKSWKSEEPAAPQKPNHIGNIRQRHVVDFVGPALVTPSSGSPFLIA
jgi:hypothetical protein